MSEKNKDISLEIIGWYGVAAVTIGYVLLTMEFVQSSNLLYQLLNLTGAASICISSFKKRDYQSTSVNGIWAFIALIGIIQILRS